MRVMGELLEHSVASDDGDDEGGVVLLVEANSEYESSDKVGFHTVVIF
jgi:hypothetical protein